MLDGLSITQDERVLDVACGTGIVARIAKSRLGSNGSVVGVDVNPDMLAVARSIAPEIDWREGNAISLPLHDGEQFDVLICQQGLQFFADRKAAVLEMRRALAEGGRLAVAVWRSDDEIPFMRQLRSIAEHHLGPVIDQRHSFGDPALLAALLDEAGFRDVRVRAMTRIIRLAADTPFPQLNAMALVGMSAGGKTMSDKERKHVIDAIATDSEVVRERYSDGSAVAFELAANLAFAGG
jgi:ubiquinone/menaquinone biosynthesis C-methylase UbiE